MYVITGATGNTGSIIADTLLAKGEKVRVIGRDAAKLERFVKKGAEAFVASLDDATALERAFAGATAVYALIPPNPVAEDLRAYQAKISSAIAAAIQKAGVAYAVSLSSLGANHAEKVGPIGGLYDLEQKLNGVPSLNALHLRPAFFMENFLRYIGAIKSMGMMPGVVKGDLSVPMIATPDIAAVATESLEHLTFSGQQVRELHGPRDYTLKEAAAILGHAIGKDGLSYKAVPGFMVKMAMRQMGLSASMADAVVEMSEAMNDRLLDPLEPRSAQNTTPTTLEQFAMEVFVPAFRGKAAASH